MFLYIGKNFYLTPIQLTQMKRLIVCCDGTANDPDQMDRDRIAPTNVVKLTRALKDKTSDGEDQLIYYDQGVGTGWWAKKFIEGLSGAGISQNIKDAYRFLAKKYEPGDEIYCFGFSRGAFTVRSLCGMIDTCGLLREENSHDDMVGKVYKAYSSTRPNDEGNHVCKTSFQKVTHDNVKVKFLGVWDTVGSLGLPLFGNNTFEWNKHHNVKYFSNTVQNAYHAVALDEQRNQFRPDLLHPEDVGDTLVQKWFAGCHSNVGGGYADAGLSDIALARMIDHSKKFGLEFSESFIKNNNNINPTYFSELRNSRTGFYKIIPPYIRKNDGEFIKAEELDESALQRLLDHTTGYFPKNIIREKMNAEELVKEKKVDSYSESKVIEELDQKFYKKIPPKQDKFPLYLANGAATILVLWLIGSFFFVCSDFGFGLSWEFWKNVLLSAWSFALYSILIPLGFLLGIVILCAVSFTIGSFFFKWRFKKQMKDKVY